MELKIVRRVTVKPAEATWTGTQALSELDHIGVTSHATVMFFYRGPIARPFEAMIDALAESLGRALARFYPLAGRLRSLGPGGRSELVCNAEGVLFVAAELEDAELSDLGDFTPTKLFDELLVPEIDIATEPLFLAQLTRFGCGGVSLSATISHAVTDGLGTAQFISEWARLSRAEPLPIPRPPCLDRTVFGGYNNPLFDHSEDFCCLPYLLNPPPEDETAEMQTKLETLTLSREQVEKLKRTANQGREAAAAQRPFTRFESVAAHVWRCATKTWGHHRGNQGQSAEQQTACMVPLNVRRRMDPPVPPEYFGNGVLDVIATCVASELVSEPLSRTAGKIRAAIDGATSEYVQSAIGFLKREADVVKFQYSEGSKVGGGRFFGNPNVGVVDWVSLPFGGMDFGWGNETHFGPGNHGIDGGFYIIASKAGDGSLLVVICLWEHHIKSFKKHFFHDISIYLNKL